MIKQRPKRQRLHQWLATHGIGQDQAATLSGLSTTMLSRIARGVRRPSPEERRAISTGLGVAESVLFDLLVDLEPDEAAIEKLCGWLRSSEGRLFTGRLLAALEG